MLRPINSQESTEWCNLNGAQLSPRGDAYWRDGNEHEMLFDLPKDYATSCSLCYAIESALGAQCQEMLIWRTRWGMWSEEYSESFYKNIVRSLVSSEATEANSFVFDSINKDVILILLLSIVANWDCMLVAPGIGLILQIEHDGQAFVRFSKKSPNLKKIIEEICA